MKKLFTILAFFLSLSFCAQNSTLDTGEPSSTITAISTPIIPGGANQIMASCPASNSLTTFYNENNGQRGIMFDVQAINSIVIQCFDVNMQIGTTNVEIYTKTGTHVGFQNTAAAWTLVGTATNVTGSGVNLATYVPVIVNTPVAAGAIQAFYITRTTAGGPIVYYKNGTAVGNLIVSDANLKIFEGTGKDYPFGASFTTRDFNGTIYYNTGILPIELVSFDVTYTTNCNALQWITATEINNDHFTIERSENGLNWLEITKVKGIGNSYLQKTYSFNDLSFKHTVNYYRLSQVDFNGNSKNFKIIVVDNRQEPPVLVKTTNMLGQPVPDDYDGVKIMFYSDGTVKKVVK